MKRGRIRRRRQVHIVHNGERNRASRRTLRRTVDAFNALYRQRFSAYLPRWNRRHRAIARAVEHARTCLMCQIAGVT